MRGNQEERCCEEVLREVQDELPQSSAGKNSKRS